MPWVHFIYFGTKLVTLDILSLVTLLTVWWMFILTLVMISFRMQGDIHEGHGKRKIKRRASTDGLKGKKKKKKKLK